MLRYLQHNKIDKKKWDICIDKAFNGIIYAYAWYLDIVSPHWDALVEGDYERVMPLTYKRKLGIHYLYPPPFTQQLGVFSISQFEPNTVEKFIQAIPKKFKFIDIYLNIHNSFSSREFTITKRTNYEIDLSQSYQHINSNYHKGAKYDIKLAAKHNLKIIKQANAKKIVEVFRKERGKNIENFGDYHYNLLLTLTNVLRRRKQVEIWGIHTEKDELCAGAIFFQSHNRSIFIFSATDKTARKTGAMRFIIDRFIYEHSSSKHILDFEGSNIPTIARLYQSFGSRDCVYLWLKQNRLPKFIKWIKK